MAKIYLIKFEVAVDDPSELYRYEVRNLKRFSYDMNTPVSPMPLPEETAEENILIKIEGNSSAFDLAWLIKDQPTDTAPLNTISGSTKSIRDQVRFFEDKFVPTSVDDSMALLIDFDGSGNLDTPGNLTYRGIFTQVHVDMTDPALLTFNARCKFLQGNVALMYEVDVVSEPLDFNVSDSVGSFDADWSLPLDEGSGTLSNYVVFFRIRGSGATFSDTLQDTPSTALFKNNITASPGIYEVFVRGDSELGLGRPSRVKIVTVT